MILGIAYQNVIIHFPQCAEKISSPPVKPLGVELRVGFNLKIFVFALLKTVQNRAELTPGRIVRLFNCNDRCFFTWREAPKPKCLPGLVSPIQV